MIYVASALYWEAEIFIKRYQLKKSDCFHRFQVFTGKNMILVITGVGEVPAAVALSGICSVCEPKEEDVFVSFGSCAAIANAEKGELCLLNQIVQVSTGRTFYPDILFSHPFREGTGYTGSKILTTGHGSGLPDPEGYQSGNVPKPVLYDMEGAASCLAASYFFEADRMAFLRVVTDYGVQDNDLKETVQKLIAQQQESIFSFCEGFGHRTQHGKRWNAEAENLLVMMEKKLHLTSTMQHSLKQHILYYLLCHAELDDILEWGRENLPEQEVDKRGGKKYFDELKRQLCGR